ncbi:MAG: Eco57I restriction-modification methylase domain-containing protein [Bacteroides sp.]|nr:Eco57I restriction-modification methylase domain-containing protein [Prevotella sp.]MCM1408726.1 Eco57I restriction-modification methylase domain-containing protein [Treponema brennaborense]MCM1470641.1 Eco57I restriction-modification methylase domain-containing protein [Bacteroides sp.]
MKTADTIFGNVYNPDVLSCLANLSSDEVFTPPEIVNQMLDMLPQELFENPDTTFLDPACKTGVFLREIAKRLIKGLEPQFPDLQERIDHIFRKQLFGIAITELTSLLSRRSVYCSKRADGEFSVSRFDSAEGNIRFKRIKHTWKNGKCIHCGASRTEYERGGELETHAYEFIHTTDLEKLFDMKFDVIISNPPYQLSDGGAQASAIPIYQHFVETAKKLKPRYLTMIIPARWFSGGRGLDNFRAIMLHDKRVCYLYDFFDSNDCFPGIDLSGGVCYFLWDREYNGKCKVTSNYQDKVTTLSRYLITDDDVFVRFNEAVSILTKIFNHQEKKFSTLISSSKPFGLRTFYKPKDIGKIHLYAYPKAGYCDLQDIVVNQEFIDKYKVFISAAYGERGAFPYLVIGKPFLGEPNSICTETYLMINPTTSKLECENVISYIKTKFFRFLVLLRKNTQHAVKAVYQFVPMQNFSKSWTDEELYAKYNLTQDEIDFIESMVRPME